MLTLGIDTTAKTASCALADGGLVAVSTVCGTLTHSETLLPMILEMLKNCGRDVNDVEIFAVSAGPGSFTGVRIGVAMIKGLAFGSGKPCVGVSTLEALAENFRHFDEYGEPELIVPVMDARRGQVYTAIFDTAGGGITRMLPDSLLTLGELRETLRKEPFEGRKVRFCGDGYALARKFFAQEKCVLETPPMLIPQNAFSVAALAERIYENSDDEAKKSFTDLALKPTYLRASQAERERDEKLARKNG